MSVPTGIAAALREASGWLVLAVVAFGCFYFFTDIRALTRAVTGAAVESVDGHPTSGTASQPIATGFDREVHLKASENGHFFSDVEINGRNVSVVVDTGATGVALTYEDARAIGISLIDSDFNMYSRTANGTARIAPVVLERVQIGDIEVRDVEAFVAEPGKLFQTLLGMSFLRRLSHIDIRGGELVLVQ